MRQWVSVSLLVVATLVAATPAHAQNACGSISYEVVVSTEGTIQTRADTWVTNGPGPCYGGYWRTEVWYMGAYFAPYCTTLNNATGGLENGACVALSANTSGRATAGATLYQYGCAEARTRHWRVDGDWTQVASTTGNIACGTPQPPPPDEYCEYEWNGEQQQWFCTSPILLPLADKRALKRDGYKLTGALQGVLFDLNADGVQEQTAWTHQSSRLALLALDRNGNGRIDNGSELFGNHTLPGIGNGFAALNALAGPVGMIRAGVPLYDRLLLWEDANHNGISEPWELVKFSDHYLGISGAYTDDALIDKWGNAFRFRGTATVRDPGATTQYPTSAAAERGLVIPVWDVFLRGR